MLPFEGTHEKIEMKINPVTLRLFLWVPLHSMLCRTLEDVGSATNRSCIDFFANVVGTNTTSGGIYPTNFTCEGDGAYLSKIDIKWGWWIDALKVACSDGNESSWFGNEDNYEIVDSVGKFGGGLKNLSAYTMDVVGVSVPAVVILYGYDKNEGYPDGMVLGPYGKFRENHTANYGEELEVSECGSNAYAVGVRIVEDSQYVYSIQLQCREVVISASCPVPDGLLLPAAVEEFSFAPTMSPSPQLDTPIPAINGSWALKGEDSWQDESIDYDGVRAATMTSNGTVIVASAGVSGPDGYIWSAIMYHLDVSETSLSSMWKWQDDVTHEWLVDEVAAGPGGDIVIIGGNESGQEVVKLDADGAFKWRYESLSCGSEGLVIMDDGSAVLGGRATTKNTSESVLASCRLYANSTVAWNWQNGTSEDDHFHTATLTDSDSVVLAGQTYGDWSGKVGGGDFAALKLDSEGSELWRWQEGSAEGDSFWGAVAGDNASVILVGLTHGNWSGTNRGGGDFAAVKLDANGSVLWRWQDGTEGEDWLIGAAVGESGTVFLGGSTTGMWDNLQPGNGYDFAGVQLSLADGTELWRWQNESTEDDRVISVAGDHRGLVILAGRTNGTRTERNRSDGNDFVAAIIDTNNIIFKELAFNTPAPFTSGQAPQHLEGGSTPVLSKGVISIIASVSAVTAVVALVVAAIFMIGRRRKMRLTGSSPT